MKNEMITYRPDDSEQVLIDASQRALEELGLYKGNSQVTTSYDLLTALSDAVKRSNLILVLVTKSEYIKIKKIVSKSLGIELVKNSAISKRLGRLADDKEFRLHDNFPKGAVVLDSKDALFSGFYLKSGNQCIVFSPLDLVRTEGILEKAGVKLNIECVVRRTIRFVGVPKDLLEKTVAEMVGIKSFLINDLRGELELIVETVAPTNEVADQQSRYVISELKKLFKSKLYGFDCPTLPSLAIDELVSGGNHIAIADTDNSMGIVSYLAYDRRAGEWCKKVRVSTSQVQAVEQDAVSELAKKVRNKSGFELALAIGDESYDEERRRSFIYGALANEQGVLTKRFWMRSDENDADFRVRCAKELVLLLYNDRIGDEHYNSVKKNAKRVSAPNDKKPDKRVENKPASEPVRPQPQEIPPDVAARKNRIAPKEDKSLTRTKVIVMLVLVAIVITMSIFISRAPESEAVDGSGDTTSTTTTTTTTTTLPSCDRCGNAIEGEVRKYVDSQGNELTLCEGDYDFMVSIEG